ncbi:MAG TPA: thioredoxin family protein [Flavobacteriales bacterium]|nr:thioredoxin family protein [Flavobacteriales bacterium]
MNHRVYELLPLAWFLGCFTPSHAQVISGTLQRPLQAQLIVLHGTRGTDHPAIDSAAVDANGYFVFPDRKYPGGFYQLGVNGNDRVDIILDPREPEVKIDFLGHPLQRNIEVRRSDENKRLWAYKLISRRGQETITKIRTDRAAAAPLDTALLRTLYHREETAKHAMDHALDSIVSLSSEGQFAYAVAADRRLEEAIPNGQQAILRALDLSDDRNLRSASYAKAIMAYVQNSTPTDDYSLHRACDSVLIAAEGDTACWSYARSFLVELFTTYGPGDVAQYLVDRYVVGADARTPPDAALLKLAAEQLRLTNGAPAPEIPLFKPGNPDTLKLSTVLADHTFTAIFFYSSTCDHCHDQMPGLRQLVTDMDPAYFHLIGIALDADTTEFNATLIDEKINWPCYSEFKGWGAQAAKDYAVKATPTLIVLDQNGRIAYKPMDHEELRAFLQDRLRR